jgi:hypothetical protein
MTPTSTGTIPQIYIDENAQVDEPRTRTVAYFKPGIPFGGDCVRPAATESPLELAEPAAIGHPFTSRDIARLGDEVVRLTAQVEYWMAHARSSNQDFLASVARERDADRRADDAETRLALVQAIFNKRANHGLEEAFDQACLIIDGRSHYELIRDLNYQYEKFPKVTK